MRVVGREERVKTYIESLLDSLRLLRLSELSLFLPDGSESGILLLRELVNSFLVSYFGLQEPPKRNEARRASGEHTRREEGGKGGGRRERGRAHIVDRSPQVGRLSLRDQSCFLQLVDLPFELLCAHTVKAESQLSRKREEPRMDERTRREGGGVELLTDLLQPDGLLQNASSYISLLLISELSREFGLRSCQTPL